MAEAKEKVVSKKKTQSKKAPTKQTEAKAEMPLQKAPDKESVKKQPETAKAESSAGETPSTTNHKPKTVAKAGKRSVKALTEAEEKQAKEERKATAKTEEAAEKPKAPVKPARPRVERRGKKYQASAKLIEKDKLYSLAEALELACKTHSAKFDGTVEMHVRLGVDPKQADQNIRDMVVLPAGTGKTVRVAVFAEEDNAKKAIAAGADSAGNEELLAKLDKGQIDFDVLIATPNLMAKLAKYARVLGPKGLMPNPKSGTVSADVAKAVSAAKAGRIEYRVDSTGIVHVGVGKVSFGAGKLNENTSALFASIKANKPASIKAIYVRSIAVTTTMGPAIKVVASEIA